MIKFLNKNGMKDSKIFEGIQNVLCDRAASYAIEKTSGRIHDNGNDHRKCMNLFYQTNDYNYPK